MFAVETKPKKRENVCTQNCVLREQVLLLAKLIASVTEIISDKIILSESLTLKWSSFF